MRDSAGGIVRVVTGPAKAGFHRVAWDLRYPTTRAIEEVKGEWNPWRPRGDSGFLAPPGLYTVTLSKRVDGVVTQLAGPVDFAAVRVFDGVLDGTSPEVTLEYFLEVADLRRSVTAADEAMELGFKRIEHLEAALARSTVDPGTFDSELENLERRLYEVDEKLAGDRSSPPSATRERRNVSRRLRVASITDGQSDYGPTLTHRRPSRLPRPSSAPSCPSCARSSRSSCRRSRPRQRPKACRGHPGGRCRSER